MKIIEIRKSTLLVEFFEINFKYILIDIRV